MKFLFPLFQSRRNERSRLRGRFGGPIVDHQLGFRGEMDNDGRPVVGLGHRLLAVVAAAAAATIRATAAAAASAAATTAMPVLKTTRIAVTLGDRHSFLVLPSR